MIRQLSGVLVLSLGMAALPPGAKAQEADPAKALDAKIHAAIYRAIDTGYKLFNANDQAGCYRVYQGALTALAPVLDYRPELKDAAEKALADAEGQGDYASRAFTLRKGLDTVYAATAGPKSLWARLGGEPAVKAVVHDFVAVAAADPKVDFTRGGKYPIDAAGVANLEKLLVQLVSATTGGPLKYAGRDMKEVHKGMGITDDQFGALAADLIGVLDKYNVPKKEKDELIAIVASTKPMMVEGAAADATPPPPTPDAPKPDPPAPDAPMPDKPAGKPLWDRLGGEAAVKAVVHDFVAKAAADPKVDFTRGGQYKLDEAGVEKLEKLLVGMISSATGGPLKYEGRDMKETHKGMKITDAQFGALAADLIEVLKEYKVPQKEIDELVGIVASTKKDIVEEK